MIKKNENSFSAVSITPKSFSPAKKVGNVINQNFQIGSKKFVAKTGTGMVHKRIIKSSTFQYSKIKSKPYGQKKIF
jgi:hypothetical protein